MRYITLHHPTQQRKFKVLMRRLPAKYLVALKSYDCQDKTRPHFAYLTDDYQSDRKMFGYYSDYKILENLKQILDHLADQSWPHEYLLAITRELVRCGVVEEIVGYPALRTVQQSKPDYVVLDNLIYVMPAKSAEVPNNLIYVMPAKSAEVPSNPLSAHRLPAHARQSYSFSVQLRNTAQVQNKYYFK